MTFPSSHIRNTIAMPAGMVIGVIMCRWIVCWDEWMHHTLTPLMIFLMLFFTFTRVDVRKLRIEWVHILLLLIQFLGGLAVFFLLKGFSLIVAQGAMICVMAPIAMAAVVIGGMLGGNVTRMTAYLLICNIVTAFVAPLVLSYVGNGECTLWQILSRVAPLLLFPFILAQIVRFLFRGTARWISSHSMISFYCWILSLTIIMGRTTVFILDAGMENLGIEIALALVSLVMAITQFFLGYKIGKRFGDRTGIGQSTGQKNTILAIWMAQSFLTPVSCIAPTTYIVWQNIVNSYQIFQHRS